MEINLKDWKDAFDRELRYWAQKTPHHHVKSIFFGGGTPSLMDPDLVHHVLETINTLWKVSAQPEVTLEMNPNEAAKTTLFGQAGVTRVSMGVQSFHPESLRHLGRTHTPEDLEKALQFLADSDLDYTFDLIYGHKHHSDARLWEHDLKKAASWVKNHISTYQLSYEPGTPFYKKRHEHLDEETLLSLEAATHQTFESMGFVRYEISNYARPGYESQHNLVYWRYQDYVAIGPGAHGRVPLNGIKNAVHNCPLPDVWMEQVKTKGHGIGKIKELSTMECLQEKALMGLRLTEGIILEELLDFGQTWHEDFEQRLKNCCAQNLLEIFPFLDGENKRRTRMIATFQGRNVLNSLLIYLFKEPLFNILI